MKVYPIDRYKSLSQENIKEYEDFALKHGATHTYTISASDVVMDYRAYYKCIIPKCTFYNTNAHCPPHAPSFESVEKLINCYSYGILIGVELPSTAITGSKSDNKNGKDSLLSPEVVAGRKRIHEVVTAVEAKAFYDGLYFATAFSGGSCKASWCPNVPCQALEEGKGCRFPLRGRPSMEGVGMDVYKMANQAGWDIYPVGSNCSAEDIPHGFRIGLVLLQ